MVAGGGGRGPEEGELFNGTELHFRKMKKLWKWVVAMVAKQ